MRVKSKRCTKENEIYLILLIGGQGSFQGRVGKSSSKTGQAASSKTGQATALAIGILLVALQLHLKRFLMTALHQRYVRWLEVAFSEFIILEDKTRSC